MKGKSSFGFAPHLGGLRRGRFRGITLALAEALQLAPGNRHVAAVPSTRKGKRGACSCLAVVLTRKHALARIHDMYRYVCIHVYTHWFSKAIHVRIEIYT